MSTPTLTPRTALFISHATPEDNHFVLWLGAKLSAMGYEVWADVLRFHGGIDWSRELEVALRQKAIKVLLVCTQGGLQKQGVRNEIEIATAISREISDATFIIPLRLESFEPPFRIAHAQYIDFKSSWALGLTELTELLKEKTIPRLNTAPLGTWLASHSKGADQLLRREEPLVSNWLELVRQPEHIYFYEAPVGLHLDRFIARQNHWWPVVPYRTGVFTFAIPNDQGLLGTDLPCKLRDSIPLRTFLKDGSPELGIDRYQARRIYVDIGSQAFDKLCVQRGLKCVVGSSGHSSWWGDIKTAPLGQIKFDWNYRRGSRQIGGVSDKRGIHWHYAVNAKLSTAPLPHLRLAARLVFSENGLDPISDVRKAHSLRRSFAKGWRNARWRDMLCAYLWWLSENHRELILPVANESSLIAGLPLMQFACPVTVSEEGEIHVDEDDPDYSLDDWFDESGQEENTE